MSDKLGRSDIFRQLDQLQQQAGLSAAANLAANFASQVPEVRGQAVADLRLLAADYSSGDGAAGEVLTRVQAIVEGSGGVFDIQSLCVDSGGDKTV